MLNHATSGLGALVDDLGKFLAALATAPPCAQSCPQHQLPHTAQPWDL